jgi:hypothetical protein
VATAKLMIVKWLEVAVLHEFREFTNLVNLESVLVRLEAVFVYVERLDFGVEG